VPVDDSTTIDFNVRHRTYGRYFRRWETAYDFKRGGIHVLDPDHDVQEESWRELVVPRGDSANSALGGVDPEAASPSSRWDAKTGHSRSYLFKHDRETVQQFDNRHRRQYNYPLFQYIVNVCTAGVLRREPERTGVDGIWDTIHKDFDLSGTSINAHERKTMALGLTFGRMHTLIDRPKVGNGIRNRSSNRARTCVGRGARR
jgi:hypothetical protein